jgi:hypothetical protein
LQELLKRKVVMILMPEIMTGKPFMNDGSCIYAPKSVRPKTIVHHLPDSVMETSGLIWWRGSYWTHNDSEGGNMVYRLDSLTGSIIQKIEVTNAGNFDWEDIDHDVDYIYIGDFGNNWEVAVTS